MEEEEEDGGQRLKTERRELDNIKDRMRREERC